MFYLYLLLSIVFLLCFFASMAGGWLWDFLRHVNQVFRFDPEFLKAIPAILTQLIAIWVLVKIGRNKEFVRAFIEILSSSGGIEAAGVKAYWRNEQASLLKGDNVPKPFHISSSGDNLNSPDEPLRATESAPKEPDPDSEKPGSSAGKPESDEKLTEDFVETNVVPENKPEPKPESGADSAKPIIEDQSQSPATSHVNQDFALTKDWIRIIMEQINQEDAAVRKTDNNFALAPKPMFRILEEERLKRSWRQLWAKNNEAFYKIYSYLTKEQLSILKQLNNGPMAREQIEKIYFNLNVVALLTGRSKSHDSVWIDFLIASELIEERSGLLWLTDSGRDFLRFIVDEGLPFDKP